MCHPLDNDVDGILCVSVYTYKIEDSVGIPFDIYRPPVIPYFNHSSPCVLGFRYLMRCDACGACILDASVLSLFDVKNVFSN